MRGNMANRSNLIGAFCAAVAAATLATFTHGAKADQEVNTTPWVEVHAARVRLIGMRWKAGEAQYLAGLEISLDDGWKTYWRMPGDSGVPPAFEWTGSSNLEKASVLYPAPVRMKEAGGEAIGYKGIVLFPIAITPKDTSAPVSLKLSLEFGICRDICIPATQTFLLKLEPGKVEPLAPSLAGALNRVPKPHHGRRKSDPELKRVRLAGSETAPVLEIEGIYRSSAKADVFVEAPQGVYVPMAKRVPGSRSDTVRFVSELSPALLQDLQGKTLTLTLVDEAGATETRWTVP
jgi:DsbC/DsbD-like thiol-disulfide interchange protein